MPLPPQPDPDVWVTWDLTFKPPERGFYVLRVRATSASGRKQDFPGAVAVEVTLTCGRGSAELRAIRRPLMTLAILFFTIMLLEVDLGHAPALDAAFLARAHPGVLAADHAVCADGGADQAVAADHVVALIVTAIAAAVGMLGSGLHMQAAGVDLEHLSRVFSSAVWGGHESPNWPVAITLAAVFGFAGAVNAHHDNESLPRDLAGAATVIAYLLIVAGIVCAAVPALTMVASGCLALAALMLLAVLVAHARGRGNAKERAMMRNALLALGAIIVIGAGFAITFAVWHRMDQARAFELGIPYTNFNFKTAHAQERGCNACHADHLAADVNRLVVGRDKPELHGIFATSYDIPMRVEDCLICHNTKTSLPSPAASTRYICIRRASPTWAAIAIPVTARYATANSCSMTTSPAIRSSTASNTTDAGLFAAVERNSSAISNKPPRRIEPCSAASSF